MDLEQYRLKTNLQGGGTSDWYRIPYTVQNGDTVQSILQNLGRSESDVLGINGKKTPSVGTTLYAFYAPTEVNSIPTSLIDQNAPVLQRSSVQVGANAPQDVHNYTGTSKDPNLTASPMLTGANQSNVSTDTSTASIQPPTTSLQPGATGTSVKQLQDYLVSKGYMTQAQVNTGYGTYGPQTTAAVKAMQSALGVNNSSGPGYYGPQTISAVQSSNNVASASSPASSTSTPAGGQNSPNSGGPVTAPPSTGNANLDQIQNAHADLANNSIASGYQIPVYLDQNNLPQAISTFLNWAHQNVDPQTQQLLGAEASNINANLSTLAKQHDLTRDQTIQQFGTDLATEQNSAGGYGTAFSGQRNLNEQNMVNTANRQLGSNDATTALNVGNQLRQGGADLGSANAGMLALPNIAGGSVSLAGGQRGSTAYGPNLDFNYNPSTYTAGNIATQQNTALGDQQSNFLKQYGTLANTFSNSGRSVNDLLGMISGRPANASTNIF